MENIKFIIKNAQDVIIEGEIFEFANSLCEYNFDKQTINVLMRGKSKRIHNFISLIDIYIECDEYFNNEEDVLKYVKGKVNINIQEAAKEAYNLIDIKKLDKVMQENKISILYLHYGFDGDNVILLKNLCGGVGWQSGFQVEDLSEYLTDQLETIHH